MSRSSSRYLWLGGKWQKGAYWIGAHYGFILYFAILAASGYYRIPYLFEIASLSRRRRGALFRTCAQSLHSLRYAQTTDDYNVFIPSRLRRPSLPQPQRRNKSSRKQIGRLTYTRPGRWSPCGIWGGGGCLSDNAGRINRRRCFEEGRGDFF